MTPKKYVYAFKDIDLIILENKIFETKLLFSTYT